MKRIAVKYTAETSAADIKEIEKHFNLTRIKRIPALRIYSYEVKGDVKDGLKTHHAVVYVEDEKIIKAHRNKENRGV
jgi:hypothetical protein